MSSAPITVYSNMKILRQPLSQAIFAQNDCELRLFEAEDREREQQQQYAALMEAAGEIEYLAWGLHPLGEDFYRQARKLRIVSNFGVGLDHLDIPLATRYGVVVANTPGGNSRPVAELVMSFVFALAKKLFPFSNGMMRGEWKPRKVQDIRGSTLGIAGFGHIAQNVAQLAVNAGMRVIFHNRTPRPELAAKLGCIQVELDELLREADFLSLNLPALPGDKPFITAAELAKMKPEAFLINTGRGSLVDLEALGAALADKRLAGAALDVFPEEPWTGAQMSAMQHPLSNFPNVICTPHMASITDNAISDITAMCLDNILQCARGERVEKAANPEVYK